MSEEPQQKIELLEGSIIILLPIRDEEPLLCLACQTRYAGQLKVENFERHAKEHHPGPSSTSAGTAALLRHKIKDTRA